MFRYLLVTDENDWNIGAEVFDLRGPLFWDVFERVWRVDTEAHQYHIGVGIRKRSKSVVVLLARGIPKGQLDLLEKSER